MVGAQARQVFDLPPVALVAVEHRPRRCGCGAVTAAEFPEATAPACYGPGVAALGAYLTGRHHLRVARAAECMAEAFGAPVSTGWLAGRLPAAEAGLEDFLAAAREHLAGAPVAHFDETRGRVAGALRWIHVASTGTWTRYHLHEKRGRAGMDDAGVLPGFTGIAVHDGLPAYRSYPAAGHGLCNAHHLRGAQASPSATPTRTGPPRWPACSSRSTTRSPPPATPAATRCPPAGWPVTPPATTPWSPAARRKPPAAADRAPRPVPPRPGRGAAGPPRRTPRRRAALRRRFPGPLRQQPGRARHPHGRAPSRRSPGAGAHRPAPAPSWPSAPYLSTARKHQRSSMDALRDLFTGHPWTPDPATG